MRALPIVLVAVLAAGCLGGPAMEPTTSSAALEPLVHLQTSMGNITIGMYEQMVPLTAKRFEDLVTSGAYDGLRFDRIVKDVDIQAGAPTSAEWTGGSDFLSKDEFHPAIRHDRPGIVSMVTNEAATGNTQFFITTAAVPDFDDRYSAFGHVVAGMDVVEAIAALPIDGETFGAPVAAVTILSTSLERPAVPEGTARHAVQLQTLTSDKPVGAYLPANFVLIVTNTGNVRDTFTLLATAPPHWNATLENPRVSLPAGRSWVLLLSVRATTGQAAPGAIGVEVHSETDPAQKATTSLQVRLADVGTDVDRGDRVRLDYTELVEDGRVSDTTVADIGAGSAYTKMPYFRRDVFEPYEYTTGQGTVAGFDDLILDGYVGEVAVARVPWPQGYASPHILYHRDLVYEVHILSATSTA